MVCSDCPKRDECRRICPELKKLLPSMDRGRLNYGRCSPEHLKRLVHNRWVTQSILDWRHILTGRQRQVLDIYYNEGVTHDAIARRLGIAQKNVTTYLQRAYRKIAAAIAKNRASHHSEDETYDVENQI